MNFTGKTGGFNGRGRGAAFVLSAALSLLTALAPAACGRNEPSGSSEGGRATAAGTAGPKSAAQPAKKYSPSPGGCVGFTVEDASALLGVPAGSITFKAEEGYEGFWQCSFSDGSGERTLSFSVTFSESAASSAEDMEKYRGNLEFASGTAPFKDHLPAGAYSDISGVGDEAVWTDLNGTLLARKGNVSIQVILPAGKMEQVRAAEAFLAKL